LKINNRQKPRLRHQAQEQAQRDEETPDDSRGSALVTAQRLREQAAAAWVDVARGRVQRRDYPAAEKAFAQARAALPSDPEALSAQASYLESQRRFGEARERTARSLPLPEVRALGAALERAIRHGAPLGETLAAQAREARLARRRGIEEEAARAGPKIQLVVALLLVPSVLLLVAAALATALLGGGGSALPLGG